MAKLMPVDELVTILAEATGRSLSDAALMAYQVALSDVPLPALNAGFLRLLRSTKFMPSPAEIREAAGMASGDVPSKDRPLLAWEAVRRAIRRVGPNESPNFADPVIHAVLRSMGGWMQVCDWTTNEMPWRETDFKAGYLAYMNLTLPDEMTARLVGIAERENGPDLPVRVVDVGCLSVGTSGESPRIEAAKRKRLLGPPASAAVLAKRLEFDEREPEMAATPPKPK